MAKRNITTKLTIENLAKQIKAGYATKAELNGVLGTNADTSDKATVYGARALAAEKVASVAAQEKKGINVDNTDAKNPKIGLALQAADNDLALNANGELFYKAAAAAEYTITKQAEAEDGYLATYQLFKDSTAVGDKINVPKDFLVKGASIKTVATADQPYEGAKVGDKYIDFEINVKSGSATTEHLYLPVQELVDAYVGDNQGIVLGANNTFSLKIKAGSALSVSNDGLDIAEASQSAKGTMSAADKTKLDGISAEAKKVEASATNGNIKIDGAETTVYTLPATTLDESDISDYTEQEIAVLLGLSGE